MRKTIAALGLLLTLASAQASEPDGDPVARRFTETVLPIIEANCVSCHDRGTRKGDLDLSVYKTVESVSKALDQWEAVLEEVESGAMPPPKAKAQPRAEERRAVVDWIRSVRKRDAALNAGDPGPVPPRRLSNAEYDATIRDLTGVDIRPTREFPVDPANEAGFDNTAESLAMSPALVGKYLEAARDVADHLVLKPEGFTFAADPAVADTDRDKFSVRRIIDFYKKQRTDYADYFLAAWKFQPSPGTWAGPDVARWPHLAAEAGISSKYLATIWSALNERVARTSVRSPPSSALWRELPPPSKDQTDAPRAAWPSGCRDFVVGLRGLARPGGQEPYARPRHPGRLADRDPLEEPPAGREPEAIRRRGSEGQAGGLTAQGSAIAA